MQIESARLILPYPAGGVKPPEAVGQLIANCRRGLTHRSCNILLGHAEDDPEKLMRIAINFAKRHAEIRSTVS